MALLKTIYRNLKASFKKGNAFEHIATVVWGKVFSVLDLSVTNIFVTKIRNNL